MNLSISSLQDAGAFTGAPVEKEITWKQDGEEVTVTAFVRKLSYKTAVSDVRQFGGDIVAGRIAACVCDESGSPVFAVEDITGCDKNGKPILVDKNGKLVLIGEDGKRILKKGQSTCEPYTERGPLNHELTVALLNAVAEVNGTIKKKKT